jgi:uncharacterized protein YjbI with pentapeptide repeats
MANPEHLAILKKGVDHWNQWRTENPNVKIDLIEANLSGVDLSGVDLSGVDLSYANLYGANFKAAFLNGAILTGANLFMADLIGAKLIRVNLEGAILTGAKLNHANLSQADFQNAFLVNADLSESTTPEMNLGGADITGAKLPDAIEKFDGLGIVEEASKIARRLYGWLLSGLAFSALTIFSTKDPQLITNSASSPLPIIQAQIPIAGFYFVAPLLLCGVFIYFHLQLLHIWRLVSTLPAVFTDGRKIDEKLYPWLLNTWVRKYFPLAGQDKLPFTKLQNFIIISLVWGSTPLILCLFWVRYLFRHELFGTIFQIALLLGTILFSISVFNWGTKALQNKSATPRRKRVFQHFISSVIIFSLTFSTSYWAFKGNYPFNADLIEAKLFDADLRVANFTGADLHKADLTDANLSRADFHKADLTGANLSGANFTEADLSGALLTNSNITCEQIQSAKINGETQPPDYIKITWSDDQTYTCEEI